jgi:hypothetical protein
MFAPTTIGARFALYGSRVIYTGERQAEVPLLGHLGEPVSA